MDDRGIPFAQPPPEPPEQPDQTDQQQPIVMWRWRRNALRRRTDRLQAWIGLGLLLAVLAATPAAMLLTGDAAHRHYTRVARHQAETRYETTAVLLYDVPSHPEPGSPEAKETRYPVKVRFTGPDGRVHTAETDAQPQLSAGSRVPVWADTDGRITDPPLTGEQVRSRSMWWALAATLTVHVTAAVAYGVTHRILQRRNLAAWDAAWVTTAPRWSISP